LKNSILIYRLILKKKFIIFVFAVGFCLNINAQQHTHSHKDHYVDLHHWEIPSKDPDRIILTFNGDPSTKRAVTWRTDSSIKKSVAQIALAGVNSKFSKNAKTYTASTEKFDVGLYKSNNSYIVHYHSVTFEKLEPNSLYAYRLGDGAYWSEWIQFSTADNKYSPTQFVYFGDAQNDILSHWSRVIRMAYQTAPNASFVIHAGDLVNTAHRDYEWAQWFKAGGFIHSQWTAIPVVGNHEFQRTTKSSPKRLSVQWRPQFTLPVEQSLNPKLHETVYSVDYQDVLIIVLNSTDFLEKQTEYIKEKLSNSNAKWKIVTSHHSIFSLATGRDFEYARKNWKPLFDKYGVDLVLNGHDHIYARGHVPVISTDLNKSENFNTLYVTSVSGPKQYKLGLDQIKDYENDGYKSDKTGEQIQFFQVISIENEQLIYKAYTATGKEYDKAVITKDFLTGTKTLK
jgi:3',5'-cyclic AMP phosphodiesterase CpdA